MTMCFRSAIVGSADARIMVGSVLKGLREDSG